MTEPENFLTRWSRKKAEAQHKTPEAADVPTASDAQAGAFDDVKEDVAQAPGSGAAAAPTAATKAEFDLASLPSLDSITSATDIRGFLAPGVPRELSRAALRRAWLADPAIRDFVGLQENDWDFTNPAAVPGFGDVPPGYDIKKMIAQIFREADPATEQAHISKAKEPPEERPQAAAAPSESGPAEQTVANADLPKAESDPSLAKALGPPEALPAGRSQSNIVRRDIDIASQQDGSESTTAAPKRRRQHGGALPQS